MIKYFFTLIIGLLSFTSFGQRSTTDTLVLEGKIMKLPKERFAQNYCITENECFVLVTDKEEHVLNTKHAFTKKLAIDNLNKNVKIKGIYKIKLGSLETDSKKCYVLNLIPNRSKRTR
jgi:hypothetical protein